MKLKKKFVISNVIMIILPIMLFVILWAAFTAVGGIRTSGSTTQNVLYFYNTELSQMKWNALYIGNEGAREMLLLPEEERVKELYDLGYHLKVTSGEKVLFCNTDDSDDALIDSIPIDSGIQQIIKINNRYIIRDSFRFDNVQCIITAVYDELRADSGTINSVIPIYIVSPAALLIVTATLTAMIITVNIILTLWLRKSVSVPMDILKRNTDAIEAGDLDYTEYYIGNDEFSELYLKLMSMRSELKASENQRKRYENARSELMRGISHDLRSPLTTIKGYAEGIRDGVADSEEKRTRYCNAIITRADDIERLTVQLSSLVRLESSEKPLNLADVGIGDYFDEFISSHSVYAEENNVCIEYSHGCKDESFRIDKSEMNRVFGNLLENTVRHRNDKSSVVKLSVTAGGGKAEIRYSDNGPGVRTEQLDRIFDSFYRGDESRTRPENGSGLGLAVVKSIIVKHGGSVSAFIENGLGILIVLPLAERKDINEKDTDNRG